MKEKYCPHCGETKPTDEFHKDRTSGDGLQGWCALCRNKAESDRRKTPECKERVKKWLKEYRKTEKGIAYSRRNTETYRTRHKETHLYHHTARVAVGRAIKSGRLERGGCVVCGRTNAEAHHEDYSKKLDVVWLCPQHHREVHAKNKEVWNEH